MSGKEIDKLFAEKLKNHGVKPSPNAWKQLDKQLGKDDKKPLGWWKWAPLLLLLIAGAAAYYLWPAQQSENFVQEATTAKQLEQSPVASIEKENAVTTKEPIQTINKPHKKQDDKSTTKTQKVTQKKTGKQKAQKTKTHKKQVATMNDQHDAPRPDDQMLDNKKDATSLVSNKVEKTKELVQTKLEIVKEPLLKAKPVPTQFPPKETQKAKKKKKRLKVKITIPSRNKRLRKLGSQQQTQGVAINFKKVLHNVFDN